MPVGSVAFQDKLVTCRDELTLCRVGQKTLRSVSCRCTLRCARAAKVTSVEEEHDSGNMTSRRQRPRSKQHNVVPAQLNEQQKLCEKTLKHQAEVDVEFHDEEDKSAEFKNQVQHSNIEQPIQ